MLIYFAENYCLLNYCLNCGAEVSGKYCHECGQKVIVRRLTIKALMEEIGHFFTHIEHYFLQTTKEFIVRPGKNSIAYLKGKRKQYQKPVSFFLIWSGLYILIHNLIVRYFHYEVSQSQPRDGLMTYQDIKNIPA
jgi:hypothetical protein